MYHIVKGLCPPSLCFPFAVVDICFYSIVFQQETAKSIDRNYIIASVATLDLGMLDTVADYIFPMKLNLIHHFQLVAIGMQISSLPAAVSHALSPYCVAAFASFYLTITTPQ